MIKITYRHIEEGYNSPLDEVNSLLEAKEAVEFLKKTDFIVEDGSVFSYIDHQLVTHESGHEIEIIIG